MLIQFYDVAGVFVYCGIVTFIILKVIDMIDRPARLAGSRSRRSRHQPPRRNRARLSAFLPERTGAGRKARPFSFVRGFITPVRRSSGRLRRHLAATPPPLCFAEGDGARMLRSPGGMPARAWTASTGLYVRAMSIARLLPCRLARLPGWRRCWAISSPARSRSAWRWAIPPARCRISCSEALAQSAASFGNYPAITGTEDWRAGGGRLAEPPLCPERRDRCRKSMCCR